MGRSRRQAPDGAPPKAQASTTATLQCGRDAQAKAEAEDGLSELERQASVISEAVATLIAAHHDGSNANVDAVLQEACKKWGVKKRPKLHRVLAAVPAQWRSILVHKLRTKPVRTASGVRLLSCWGWMVQHGPCSFSMMVLCYLVVFCLSECVDRGGSCHVQAASMSTYHVYWQYLRVLPRWS